MTYAGIIITFVFINNIVLTQMLGICPYIGMSRNMQSAAGLGFAVTFVSALAALATWAVYHGVLLPLGVPYLQTVVFILVITGLIQTVERILNGAVPQVYKVLGVFLPLVNANCAVFGISLIAVRSGYTALESLVAGFSAGGGFFLAIVLLSSLRDSMRKEWIPKPFQGLPITLISAGLMALAFMAFDRTLLQNLIG